MPIYLQNEMKIAPNLLKAYFKVLSDKGMSEENETIYIFQSFLQFVKKLMLKTHLKYITIFREKYGKYDSLLLLFMP